MSSRYPWTILWIAAILSIAVVAWALLITDLDERYRAGLWYTARVSGAFFLLAFSAGPLYRLTRHAAFRFLVLNRRYIGLGCALAHTVHLAFIIVWAIHRPEDVAAMVVVLGGFGYMVLYAMAATSNDASVRRLGTNWKRLHTFGIYYVWFIFIATFAGHETIVARSFTMLFAVAMAARLAALALPRFRKQRA